MTAGEKSGLPLEFHAGGQQTAHEYAREALRKAILRGELAGGSRLVQGDVAAQLRVSTTPVREALRDLATEGLITLDRHRAGFVKELNWDDMQELVVIRQWVEQLAVRLAIQHITDAEIDLAEAISDRMQAETDLGSWVDLNQRFHTVFHDATRSPRLSTILRGLQESAAMFVAQAQRWEPETGMRSSQEHTTLVRAMRRRDVQAAIDVQLRHVAAPLELARVGRDTPVSARAETA